MSEKAH